MSIRERAEKEARVLGGMEYGEHFTIRLDHLALILLPLAAWYEPMSAWYDIIDMFLAWVIYGFILGVYGVGVMLVWMLSQKIGVLKKSSPSAFDGTSNSRFALPSFKYRENPEVIFTSLAGYIGWSWVLVRNDMPVMWFLLSMGIMLYPVAGAMGKKFIQELNDEESK